MRVGAEFGLPEDGNSGPFPPHCLCREGMTPSKQPNLLKIFWSNPAKQKEKWNVLRCKRSPPLPWAPEIPAEEGESWSKSSVLPCRGPAAAVDLWG